MPAPLAIRPHSFGGPAIFSRSLFTRSLAALLTVPLATVLGAAETTPVKLDPVPKPLASDPAVKLDYDIVYVRAPRFYKATNGRNIPTAWPEFGHPTRIDPGYDLMLLKPDGKEEVLVAGGKGAVTDPFVSLDGKSVYYSYHHDPKAGEWAAGADIYRIDVATRKITRLTHRSIPPTPASPTGPATTAPAKTARRI